MSGVRQATNSGDIAASGPSLTWWKYNALFWGTYGAVLMIPWLDRYSVLYMLPNKVVIAATGVGITALLRALYRRIWRDGAPKVASAGFSLLACLVGAVLFDVTVVAITQGPDAISFRLDGTFGSIVEGVPMLGRTGQYLTLLIAWSLAHHLLTSRAPVAVPVKTAVGPVEATSDATLAVSGTTVRVRDGSRTILFERDEIDWIAADGDYVRLHCGAKSLLIRATMKHAERTLTSSGFVRVHRSAIVNPSRVREIVRDGNDHTVVLRNGVRVRAGRNYAAQLQLLSRGDAEN